MMLAGNMDRLPRDDLCALLNKSYFLRHIVLTMANSRRAKKMKQVQTRNQMSMYLTYATLGSWSEPVLRKIRQGWNCVSGQPACEGYEGEPRGGAERHSPRHRVGIQPEGNPAHRHQQDGGHVVVY